MKLHWSASFAVAFLAIVTNGCDPAPLPDTQILREEKSQVTKSKDTIQRNESFHTSEVKILRVGKSNFYIPISWLEYNRMLNDNSSAAGQVKPPFLDKRGSSSVHILSPASKGIIFRIRNGGGTIHPSGVNPNSSVSSIGFLRLPSPTDMDDLTLQYQKISLEKVRLASSDDGWVKFENRYYDVREKSADQLIQLPMVESGAALHVSSGSHRYNDDVIIFYTWTPNSIKDHSSDWRELRASVDRLINWLALPSDQRPENPNFLVGDLLGSQGSEK